METFIQAHGRFKALGLNFSDYTPPYLYLLSIELSLVAWDSIPRRSSGASPSPAMRLPAFRSCGSHHLLDFVVLR